MYMNKRGLVTVPQSTPTVLNWIDTVPLRAGKSALMVSRSVLPPLLRVARK